MLPLVAPVFGCGGKFPASGNGPPACSSMEPTYGMIEKDLREGDSIIFGNGVGAGCKKLEIYWILHDTCGESYGSPYVALQVIDEEGNPVSLIRELTSDILVESESDRGPGLIIMQYSDVNPGSNSDNPSYIRMDGKLYKIELVDSNSIKKVARIRVTDMDSGSELPNYVGDGELVSCTPLTESELEGTPLVSGVLYLVNNPMFPSPNEVLTMTYEGEIEELQGINIHFYVINIEEYEEHGPVVRLGAVMGSAVFTHQYAQECSWFSLPCVGGADYHIYISAIDTSSPRKDEWPVEIRIHKLIE